MKKTNATLMAAVFAATTCMAIVASASDSSAKGDVVNINTATETQLAYLPGLGPSKAQAIIQHRTKRPFKKVEDLMRVKGIGRKTFKKLRPYLAVTGETTAKSKIKPAS